MSWTLAGRTQEMAWVAKNTHQRWITLVGLPGVGKTALLSACLTLQKGTLIRCDEHLMANLMLARQSHDVVGLDDVDNLPPTALAKLQDFMATCADCRVIATSSHVLRWPFEAHLMLYPPSQEAALSMLVEMLKRRGINLPDEALLRPLVHLVDGFPSALWRVADYIDVAGLDETLSFCMAELAKEPFDVTKTLTRHLSTLPSELLKPLILASVFSTPLTPKTWTSLPGQSLHSLRKLAQHGLLKKHWGEPPTYSPYSTMVRHLRQNYVELWKEACAHHARWAVDSNSNTEKELALRRSFQGEVSTSLGVEAAAAHSEPPRDLFDQALHIAREQDHPALLDLMLKQLKFELRHGDEEALKTLEHELEEVAVRRGRLWFLWRTRAALETTRGNLEGALDAYNKAIALAPKEALFELNYHKLGLELANGTIDAKQHLQKLREMSSLAPDDRARFIVLGSLGSRLLCAGHLQEAKTTHERALQIPQPSENHWGVGIIKHDLASIALIEGHLSLCVTLLDESIQLANYAEDTRRSMLSQALKGAVQVRMGHPLSHASQEAQQWLIKRQDPRFSAAGSFCQMLAKFYASIQVEDRLSYDRELFEHSPEHDPHYAMLWQHHLDLLDGNTMLVVDRTRHLVAYQAQVIDLSKRTAMRLIFERLVAQHISTDDPLGLEELIDAGWPGQQLIDASARNRLHVALSSLRKAGLLDLLIHDQGRYQLAHTTQVFITSPSGSLLS